VVAAAGTVAFAFLAWWLVPWHPVPGGPVDPVAATEMFSTAEIARAEEFSRWARVWSWSGLVVSLVVACWLGFTTAGRRLVDRLPGPWWMRVVLAVATVELVGRVATLPMSVAAHQHRVNAGLSTQGWGSWLRDVAVSQLAVMLVTAGVLVLVVGSARRWRRIWPAVAGGLVGALVLLGSYVYPVAMEPLFNDFASLPAGELRTSILVLADEQGVELEDVLVADASRRTTTLNAYVSGFGSTRRVVLYDTLVADTPQHQVLSVVAHELAHAHNRDVLVGTALGMAGAVTGVGLLALLIPSTSRTGGVADPRSVPTILALLAVATLVTAPVQNGISRLVETRADVQALAATDDPHAFVGLQRALTLRSLADSSPPRWAQWWFGSHPTVLSRVALSRLEVPRQHDALACAAESSSPQVSVNMPPDTTPRA
jgi:STE24 endopeptidase